LPKINRAIITGYELITSYGLGINALWDGLIHKKSAISKLKRFPATSFQSENAATISSLTYQNDESLVIQMLKKVFLEKSIDIPKDAFLILATTVGEIDLLEKNVLEGKPEVVNSRFRETLKKIKELLKLKSEGIVISCACASSSSALAYAASLIRQGKKDCVLIVACDCVSEFVFSGFSSLMALDKIQAKPFDKFRSGLSLGEAAGFILLMSEKRARLDKEEKLAEIAGWGYSCDANHMTGPSRQGLGLIKAINAALKSAGSAPNSVGCIAAHGTGTVYNDAMELVAFKEIFNDSPVPVYSIKGGTGHTLGAAGLVETIMALKVLKEKIIPPTVGLEVLDDQALGWVSLDSQRFKKKIIISNNCGFGGINAALALRSLD